MGADGGGHFVKHGGGHADDGQGRSGAGMRQFFRSKGHVRPGYVQTGGLGALHEHGPHASL